MCPRQKQLGLVENSWDERNVYEVVLQTIFAALIFLGVIKSKQYGNGF